MGERRRIFRPGGSVVAQLTLWYAASLFVLIFCTSGFLYWNLTHTMAAEDNAVLRDRIQALSTALARSPSPLETLKRRVESEWATRQEERIFIRVVDARANTVAESPAMPPRVPGEVFANVPMVGTAGEKPHGRRFETSSGRVVLALAGIVSVPSLNVSPLTVYAALDLEHEETLLRRYRATMLAALLGALALSILLGRKLANAAFEPLARIMRTTQRIRSSTLHERLPEATLPEELRTLARTINEMLERLEEAFERLSRFSSDIAHELRTPINNIRGEVEVALSRERPVEEYREVLGSSLEELGRISKMIDSLLFIAKAEDPKLQVVRERVRLRAEILNIVDFYDAAAADASVSIRVEVPEALELSVERTLFQRAVGNLVANAITHTPRGGVIGIRADERPDGQVELQVWDTGEGISAENLPHVFDRFFRADPSRRATQLGGFGLGLTIVKSIQALHGGDIHIESQVGQGTRVTLEFPKITETSS